MWRMFEQCSATHKHCGYMTELELILPQFRGDSIEVQWIKGGKRGITPPYGGEEYYCHIIINDDEKRAMVIAVLENHLRNYPSSEIEGYVVGRSSIAVIPRLEDGPTIGKNIVTCDG